MADLIVKIDGDIKGYKSKLDEVDKSGGKLQKTLSSAAKGGAIAFAGLTTALGLAVNEAAKFEQIETQFEVLTGSAQKATQVVKDLQQFAASTPFQFEGIAKTGQQLLAFGFTAEELPDKLQKIGDVAAATGAPLERIGQVFGQISVSGKLTGERLNQLQEAGVPIGPALAKSMGVAEQSIRDLVSQGKVSAEDFQKAFASLSEKGGLAFEGMVKQSKTFNGVISTVKDNVSLFAADIGKELLPILKDAATRFLGWMQRIRESGEAVETFRTILIGTQKAVTIIKSSFSNLGTIIGGGLATAIEAATQALKGNFSQAKTVIVDGTKQMGKELATETRSMNQTLDEIDKSAHEARIARKEEQNAAIVEQNKVKNEKLTEQEVRRQEALAEAEAELDQMRFEQKLARDEEYQAIQAEIAEERRAAELEAEQAKFEEDLAREKDQTNLRDEVRRENQLNQAKEDKKRRKQFLKDEEKFGKAYAMINQAMHSAVYQGTKSATSELAVLQNSSNNTLKSIGKAAAISQIGIKTAESAMNIFNGFSTIPIVGIALGIAGAAAAVAYGATQIAAVNKANTGGMIGGNMLSPNKDSVLSFLTPGEFVTPRQNYNETVEAVADRRLKEREGLITGGDIAIRVEYESEEAEKIMTVQQNEATFLGISRSIA